MSSERYIAAADCDNDRVSVFSVDGEFIRHVGEGEVRYPFGVACSAFDELVVADRDNGRVVVCGVDGGRVMTMGSGGFRGVAIHGAAIFAHNHGGEQCVVFE